jgi:hypothetical protein
MTPEMNAFSVEQHLGPFDSCHPLRSADYAGIYFLCCGTSIVYVGKTKSIAKRIAQHVGIKDFDAILVMRVPEELLWPKKMPQEGDPRRGAGRKYLDHNRQNGQQNGAIYVVDADLKLGYSSARIGSQIGNRSMQFGTQFRDGIGQVAAKFNHIRFSS